MKVLGRGLVVDDKSQFRAVTSRMLQAAGHYVECAANGLEAMQRPGRSPDLRGIGAAAETPLDDHCCADLQPRQHFHARVPHGA